MDLLLFRIQVQRDTLCVVCDFGLRVVLDMPWKVIQHRKVSLQIPQDDTRSLRQNFNFKDPKGGYCYGSMLELGICWVECPVTGESILTMHIAQNISLLETFHWGLKEGQNTL